MIFSSDDLLIFLRRTNLEICEHSSFLLIIDEIVEIVEIVDNFVANVHI